MSIEEYLSLQIKFDLILMTGVLPYLKNWEKAIAKATDKGKYLYISVFIPLNPIGFVKSFTDLKRVFSKYFSIQEDFFYKERRTIFILGKALH